VRAKERLSGSSRDRKFWFGDYGERTADDWATSRGGLPPELSEPLRAAVRGHLASLDDLIAEQVSIYAGTHYADVLQPTTTLKTGHFGGDIIVEWEEVTIQKPEKLDFRWQTDAASAERGVWELVRKGDFGAKDVHIAYGLAGDAPGQVFTIDFAKYLPPSPGVLGSRYVVRVTPGTAPHFVTSSSDSHAGKAKKPGKAVGPPSNDVKVIYSPVGPPPTEFEFVDCYTHLQFLLGSLKLVKDQVGAGSEEFYVAGFVHETLGGTQAMDGGHENHGPFYRVLDPDGPTKASLNSSTLFTLSPPSTDIWPLIYTTMFSILEVDGGSSLGEWQSAVWEIADLLISPQVGDFVNEYLQEHYSEYLDDLGQAVQSSAQLAQFIASLIGEAIAGIAGLVIVAAAFVIGGIIAGSTDDYYGTEFRVLVVPSPAVDIVHMLPGSVDADGDYVLDPVKVNFYGATSYPEAASWDGKVQVDWAWTFYGKELY
jgi:hypothetical protein